MYLLDGHAHLPPPPDPRDQELRHRIRAEFADMPGLKLTLPQASRLFHEDSIRCRRALDMLVEGGSLAVVGGSFRRTDVGCFDA